MSCYNRPVGHETLGHPCNLKTCIFANNVNRALLCHDIELLYHHAERYQLFCTERKLHGTLVAWSFTLNMRPVWYFFPWVPYLLHFRHCSSRWWSVRQLRQHQPQSQYRPAQGQQHRLLKQETSPVWTELQSLKRECNMRRILLPIGVSRMYRVVWQRI